MKILVYGAGNIGSLYATKLKQAGNNVAILACGLRLDEIHEHVILLQEFQSGLQTMTRIDVVEELAPDLSIGSHRKLIAMAQLAA